VPELPANHVSLAVGDEALLRLATSDKRLAFRTSIAYFEASGSDK